MSEEKPSNEKSSIAPVRLLSRVAGWLILGIGVLLLLAVLWDALTWRSSKSDHSMSLVCAVGFITVGLVVKLLGP